MEIKTIPAAYNLSILVVDDHPVFRHGMVEILKAMSFVNHVSEAGNGAEAMACVNRKKFDIILLDIEMPIKGGLTFLEELNRKPMRTKPKTIIISTYCEQSKVLAAQQLFVYGYIMKDTPVKELREALMAVADGNPYFSENIRKIMVDSVVKNRAEHPNAGNLTKKEEEVLLLVCRKLSNKQIAEKLILSEKTIKRHRTKLRDKIGAKNVAGLIIYAIQNGIYRV